MYVSTRCRVCAVLLLASLLNLQSASAARVEDLMTSRSLKDLNRAHLAASKKPGPEGRAQSYAEIFNLETDSTFKVLDSDQLRGLSNYRFQQMFRGVPVYQGVVVLGEDAEGLIRFMDGDVVHDIVSDVPSIAAVLSEQRALEVARRIALTGALAGFKSEIEKVEKLIHVDDRKRARLVYRVAMYVPHPTGAVQPTLLIDANSGEVLTQWNAIRNAGAAGNPPP